MDRPYRIAAVSFLNSRPLIHGLEDRADVALARTVPSGLGTRLDQGQADLALVPAIDYQRSRNPWCVLPHLCIGCDGATHTVRIFSRVPIGRIRRLHCDTDSHTSVALAKIVLARPGGLS